MARREKKQTRLQFLRETAKKSLMEIIVAEKSGFCFGVQKACKACEKYFGTDFRTLGPLIHNEEILEKIRRHGGKIIQTPAEAENATVIIRTHGISEKSASELRKRAKIIEDATCPFVQRLQKAAKDFAARDFFLVIVGKAEHPEIRALTEDIVNSTVVFSAEEARVLTFYEKIAVVAQTTEREEKFYEIQEILREKCGELEAMDTMCRDVRTRQKEARELAQKVDVMIIVGGRESSNTKKIFEVSVEETAAYQVEDENGLEPAWFTGCRRVGVITGASTPQETLERVVARLRRF